MKNCNFGDHRNRKEISRSIVNRSSATKCLTSRPLSCSIQEREQYPKMKWFTGVCCFFISSLLFNGGVAEAFDLGCGDGEIQRELLVIGKQNSKQGNPNGVKEAYSLADGGHFDFGVQLCNVTVQTLSGDNINIEATAVFQSSTNENADPFRAVDGDSSTCSITKDRKNPSKVEWWKAYFCLASTESVGLVIVRGSPYFVNAYPNVNYYQPRGYKVYVDGLWVGTLGNAVETTLVIPSRLRKCDDFEETKQIRIDDGPNGNFLQICEIEAFDAGENQMNLFDASMGTVGWGGFPDIAIDGDGKDNNMGPNDRRAVPYGSRCVHSNYYSGSWTTNVCVREENPVQSVIVYNRNNNHNNAGKQLFYGGNYMADLTGGAAPSYAVSNNFVQSVPFSCGTFDVTEHPIVGSDKTFNVKYDIGDLNCTIGQGSSRIKARTKAGIVSDTLLQVEVKSAVPAEVSCSFVPNENAAQDGKHTLDVFVYDVDQGMNNVSEGMTLCGTEGPLVDVYIREKDLHSISPTSMCSTLSSSATLRRRRNPFSSASLSDWEGRFTLRKKTESDIFRFKMKMSLGSQTGHLLRHMRRSLFLTFAMSCRGVIECDPLKQLAQPE